MRCVRLQSGKNIHLELESFLAVPGLQTGSQTFQILQVLTDIKKILEIGWHATTITNFEVQNMAKVALKVHSGLVLFYKQLLGALCRNSQSCSLNSSYFIHHSYDLTVFYFFIRINYN